MARSLNFRRCEKLVRVSLDTLHPLVDVGGPPTRQPRRSLGLLSVEKPLFHIFVVLREPQNFEMSKDDAIASVRKRGEALKSLSEYFKEDT